MNKSPRSYARKIFILTAIVVTITIGSLITIGYSGLAGINADNRDKIFVYDNFSENRAEFIKTLSVYAAIPLALATGLLAAVNVKITRRFISFTVLLSCVALVVWVLFASWATEGNYAIGSSNNNPDLRIHTINL